MTDASAELLAALRAIGLPRGGRILVAVSGGPDSVALLDTVNRQREQNSWTVWVVHVNHGLRGTEGDEDEAFVRNLAAERDLPFLCARVDTRSYAARHSLSLETAGRELRYASFDEWRAQLAAEVVLTGHTADDQAETVIMHLLRGAGLTGLAGMQASRGFVCRPFLPIRHDTIVRALQERDLGYRLDPSNLDTVHVRNRVRHTVFPALREVVRDPVRALQRSADMLGRDAAYVMEERERALRHMGVERSAEHVSASRSVWLTLHHSLRRHTLFALLAPLLSDGHQLTAGHIEDMVRVIENADGRISAARLPGNIRLVVDALRFSLLRGRESSDEAVKEQILPVPGAVELPFGRLTSSIVTMQAAEIERLLTVCGPFTAVCDGALAEGDVRVRSRLPGDRMRPAGLHGSRKVQDIMVDAKIPSRARSSWPVVTIDGGIVWIPGARLDERANVEKGSTRVLLLRYSHKQGEAP